MKKYNLPVYLLAGAALLAACDDDDNNSDINQPNTSTQLSEEYYAGGELGTVFNATSFAYEQPTPACENQGMAQAFKFGEYLFEKDFNQNEEGAFAGLGPLMVRRGCLYCHPQYGHGKRQTEYRADKMGNGYLLVITDENDTYLSSLTGMPQTLAVEPFKAPIDESKIRIEWLDYTDEWGNQFPDGESYSLIYPQVTIPADAYYVPLQVKRNGETVTLTTDEVRVRLESTIGVYGTGLLDAIPDDSLLAQWRKEESYGVNLNPSMFANGEWTSMYSGLTGKKYARRYTYALSRGPVLDGAGANAIWNITNVTRSDRRYHYMTTTYAEVASKDPEVQADFYKYFPAENKTGNVEQDIYNYLVAPNKDLPVEMSDEDYKNFMIWHRGLAVPAARDLDKASVQRGKQLFTTLGCAECHRPSWTTGDDHIEDPNGMFTDDDMPRYPHQKIWPYTDMVQHKLHMVNDIRTGWCRTTPLWGRGLSKMVTGADDRMHDCRARGVLEAIMWHGAKDSDARWTVEKFRALSKEDRDAVVEFIEAI
jgi:CxxC motif-containing protein (DUF1111 family)